MPAAARLHLPAAAAACGALLLSACSMLPIPGGQEPEAGGVLETGGAKLAMTLNGYGVQQFRCESDSEGHYWKFVTPWADLKDSSGRVVATQGKNFTFSARDGSKLSAKIVESEPGRTDSDLLTVVFETSSYGSSGILSGIRYVKRDEASGGVPKAPCSPSQAGQTLKVRFAARFSFYK